MPLNASLAGRTYPPLRYEVCREKLREFARAVGEDDAVYHDLDAARAAGHADLPAVPTFPVVLSYQVGQQVYADPELGLDYSRVLHGEQEFTYERPVMAGDHLVATGRIDKIVSRGRYEMVSVETRIETEAAELVCLARSTIVLRPVEEPAPEAPGAAGAEAVGAPTPAPTPGGGGS